MRSGMASNIANHRLHWQPGAARPGTRGQRPGTTILHTCLFFYTAYEVCQGCCLAESRVLAQGVGLQTSDGAWNYECYPKILNVGKRR
jgi:hypothetical protein